MLQQVTKYILTGSVLFKQKSSKRHFIALG